MIDSRSELDAGCLGRFDRDFDLLFAKVLVPGLQSIETGRNVLNPKAQESSTRAGRWIRRACCYSLNTPCTSQLRSGPDCVNPLLFSDITTPVPRIVVMANAAARNRFDLRLGRHNADRLIPPELVYDTYKRFQSFQPGTTTRKFR